MLDFEIKFNVFKSLPINFGRLFIAFDEYNRLFKTTVGNIFVASPLKFADANRLVVFTVKITPPKPLNKNFYQFVSKRLQIDKSVLQYSSK